MTTALVPIHQTPAVKFAARVACHYMKEAEKPGTRDFDRLEASGIAYLAQHHLFGLLGFEGWMPGQPHRVQRDFVGSSMLHAARNNRNVWNARLEATQRRCLDDVRRGMAYHLATGGR